MLRGIIKKGITIIVIVAIAILVLSQLNISGAATVGQTVNFNGKDLPDKDLKFEGNKIYCIQKGVEFNRNGSGRINRIVEIDESSSAQDLATAYVLSNPDTALDSSAIDSRDLNDLVAGGWDEAGVERWLMNGIYLVTSINQNAIWAIKNDTGMSASESNFVSETSWDSAEGKSVTYHWDTDSNGTRETYKLEKNGEYFKFNSSNVQYTQIQDVGYYNKGLKLYQDAINFANNYDIRYIENTTVGTPAQDYSDPNYILIGPYSVSVFSEITGVTFKDQNGTTINSSDIGIFTKSGSTITPINLSTWTGGNFYIGLKKSATSISEVKTVTFTSEKEVISGKIYYIDCGTDQNLVCGDVELKEESKDFPIDLNQEIIPPRLEKVTILKSELGGGILSGAKFNITLNNVKSIGGGYSTTAVSGKIILSNATTNSNGEIVLEELEIADVNTDITIEIEEAEAPDRYKKIDGTIKIVIERDGNSYKVSSATTKDGTVTDSEFKASDVTISANDEVTIKINNIKLVNLSGIVWLDGQQNEKEIREANGLKEQNENGIDGVLVYLCDKNGNIIDSQPTSSGGIYNFIDKPAGEYQIKFQYNGIWYEDVGNTGDSKAEETATDRTTFNNRFTTISQNQSNDGTALAYTYNSGEQISTLNADVKGTNTASGNEDFKIIAQTGVTDYRNDTQNINCGLIDRYFDLAIGTDVKEATATINGKTVTYNYAQIMDGELDKISSSRNDVEYNLYLYKSDYYYRILDYKTDGSGIANKVNSGDYTAITPGNELELKVTYTIILKNQSKHDAIVEEFVYYYDENYIPLLNVGDNINGYEVKSIADNKITFGAVGGDNSLSEINDYRKTLDITFEVNKTNISESNNYCTNITEITKYSTTEGLIDEDSAPGNGIQNKQITQYEDDTDEAKGINIKVGDKTRTIKGTVWDDGAKNEADGKLISEENKVNDVIVQLIEIKNISGNYYEYIWQETRSGRNEVKTTARNGYTGESYTNSVAENSGMFEFTDFIPGNYIIRYIYGDGTTYDATSNVEKYNGQDYQSTIDSHYKTSWYNTAGYAANQSVARDNEARRLEVMAYSTKIDETIGKALEEKTALNETWMCAETSRINVPVDAVNKATESDNTTVSFENIENNIEFNNINFGLALRPQTKLVLEKHITGLKITPNGVGVQPIVEAKIDIKDILNKPDSELQEKLQGVTSGLSIIKSDRDNRGFWKVETDIEELAQGATLEVEYTYVIKNESDKDYLNSVLVNEYQNNLGGYENYLRDLKDSVKAIMRTGQYAYSNDNAIGGYLGEFYYTGVKGVGDVEVLSRVDNLKESLNEQFGKQEKVSDYFNARALEDGDVKKYLDRERNSVTKNIVTVLESNSTSKFLVGKSGDEYTEDDTDWSKTAKVTTVLASASSKGIGGTYPSYIAEITSYSNAAGRRSMNGTPDNLQFVHSEDTTMTMNTDNELDEFWGESIIISKPTGEDKLTGVQIAIITTISVAILGAGIVLIKKYVLKK